MSDNGRIDIQVRLQTEQLSRSVSQAKRDISGMGNTATTTSKEVEDAYSRMTKDISSGVSKAVGGMKNAFIDLGKSILGISALIQGGSFIKELYGEVKEFNKQMKIVSTISSEVAGDMDGFKNKVMDICKEISVAPETAAQGLYQISSAGWLGADGLQLLEKSARLAVGGVTDVSTAADAMTTIMNAYHMKASEAEAVSDKLFTTVRLGKTSMDELGHSISAVAPTAATFNVSIDEVLAMIAELTKQGVPTATAIRQINMAILATTQSLGDGAFKTRTLLQAFEEVERKSQGSENALKKDMGNVNALRAVLAATGKNAEESAQMLEEMKNSAGATEAAFQKMNSTAGAQLTILKTNFLDAFRSMADGANSILGGLAKWMNEAFATGNMQKCLSVLTYLIATYGVYKATIVVVTALQKLYNGVLAEAAYQKALAAQRQITLTNAQAMGAVVTSRLSRAWKDLTNAMKRNAFGLIVTAAVALGYALYKVATRTTELEKATKSVTDAMTEAGISAKEEKDEIQKLLNTLATASKNSKEYKDAKDRIINQYSQYLQGLINEKGEINDLAEAYRVLAREAEEAARKRALLKASDTARDKKLSEDEDAISLIVDGLMEQGYSRQDAMSMASRIQQGIMKDGKLPADLTNKLINYTKEEILPLIGQYTPNESILSRLPAGKTYYTPEEVSAAFKKAGTSPIRGLGKNAKVNNGLSKLRDNQNRYQESLQMIETSLGIDNFDTSIFDNIDDEQLQAWIDQVNNYTDISGKRVNFKLGDKIMFGGTKSEEEARTLVARMERYLADRRFANSLNGSTDGGAEDQKEVKNKEYWEKQRDDAQAILDKLGDDEMNSKEAIDAKQKLEEAKKKLQERADMGKPQKGLTDEQKRANEKAKRDEKISDYITDTEKAVRDAQFEIREAEIAAMDEGVDKELASIDLAYDKLQAANEDRLSKMIEDLANKEMLEWQNAHPAATEAEALAYRANRLKSLKKSDLPSEQQNIIDENDRIIEETTSKARKDALDKMVQDVADYEQQRKKIIEDSTKQIEDLYEHETDASGNTVRKKDAKGNDVFKSGVGQSNIDEINYKAQESLRAIDEAFANRSEEYQAWCGYISDLALDKLQTQLELAKKALESMPVGADPVKQAVAIQKVYKLTEAIAKKKAEYKVSPGKQSKEEWDSLKKTLEECMKELDNLGNAFDGSVADAIKSAALIASSTIAMVDGIKNFVEICKNGVMNSAKTAVSAVKLMESASVILAVISAAFTIASKIASLFNNNNKKREEIDALQKRIDQLQWELDNADTIRSQSYIRSGSYLTNIKKTLYDVRMEIVRSSSGLERFMALMGRASSNTNLLNRTASKLADTYANVSYMAGKALGASRFEDARKQLENISKQQMLVADQLALESSIKKKDQAKIAEYEQKIEELGYKAIQIINEMVDEIIGSSAEDIAKQLGDAFIDAFQTGQDAAEAWGDKVNDIVADITRRMLIQQFLEEPLGSVFDQYKKKWFPGGNFVGLQAVIDSMQGFADDLNVVGDQFAAIWETLPNSVRDAFTVTAHREAQERGIANASQDSVDENNARLTAIQGHTYTINENTKLLVNNSNRILESVMNIDRNTDSMDARLSNVEGNIRIMRDTIDDISLHGLKLK